jgi:hypothetical protein
MLIFAVFLMSLMLSGVQVVSYQFRSFNQKVSCIHSLIRLSVNRKTKNFSAVSVEQASAEPVLRRSTGNTIRYTIYGEPIALARHRTTKTGMVYNPSAKLQDKFFQCSTESLPLQPFEGPLEAELIFYFGRPKIHYRSGKNSHLLKENAAALSWYSRKPGKGLLCVCLQHLPILN